MVHAVYESPVLRATCPVFFITAVDDDARKPQATQLGCVAYLHKPFPAAL